MRIFYPLVLTFSLGVWLLRFLVKPVIKLAFFLLKSTFGWLFESSKSHTVKEVNEGVEYRGSSCTELILEDDTRRYMKTSTHDPHGKITRRAKELLGKRILLFTRGPALWSSDEYFSNIKNSRSHAITRIFVWVLIALVVILILVINSQQ